MRSTVWIRGIASGCRGRIWFLLPVLMFVMGLCVQVKSVNPPPPSPPPDWTVGDVFVGKGNGSFQVWHSANLGVANPTYSILDTIINDGTTTATAGCGFDSAYRFFGTNFGGTLVDRYSI